MGIACPHKRGRLAHHLTLLLQKMDWSCAAYFNQEEQVVRMDSYEEYKNVIMAKSNTVAANKAREEFWQKTV